MEEQNLQNQNQEINANLSVVPKKHRFVKFIVWLGFILTLPLFFAIDKWNGGLVYLGFRSLLEIIFNMILNIPEISDIIFILYLVVFFIPHIIIYSLILYIIYKKFHLDLTNPKVLIYLFLIIITLGILSFFIPDTNSLF